MDKQRPILLESDEHFRRRVISSLGLLLGTITFIGTISRYLIAPMEPVLVFRTLSFGAALLTIPVAIRRGFGTTLCGNLLISFFSGIAINAGLINGGIRAPATVIFVITPVIGFFCSGKSGARFALSASVLGIVLLLFGEKYSFVLPLNHPEKYTEYKSLIFIVGAVISYGVGAAYERSRRITEKALEELSSKAANASKMSSLGEMAAGVAHEINNPLAIVSGKVVQLKRKLESADEVDKGKFVAELETIERTVHRMAKIVNGLRAFSRNSERDEMLPSKISTIIEETLELCSERFKFHHVEVRVTCDNTIETKCRAAQISQVILNLLNNSFDAIEPLSKKWIEIKVTTNNPTIQISVTDSGSGISPEVVAKMIQPFFTTKGVGKGTGLGLSISNGICQDHNGQLRYDPSCPNTRFIIELPTAAAEPLTKAV